jgi:hypothetical protein
MDENSRGEKIPQNKVNSRLWSLPKAWILKRYWQLLSEDLICSSQSYLILNTSISENREYFYGKS